VWSSAWKWKRGKRRHLWTEAKETQARGYHIIPHLGPQVEPAAALLLARATPLHAAATAVIATVIIIMLHLPRRKRQESEAACTAEPSSMQRQVKPANIVQ
jgi:hypothetical protein